MELLKKQQKKFIAFFIRLLLKKMGMWHSSRHTSVDTNIVKNRDVSPGAVRLECIKRLREYIRNDTEEISATK